MIPLRLARELTHQLERAGEHERLARALASVPVFLVLWKGEGESDILALWQQLAGEGHEPEKYYPASLDALRVKKLNVLPNALQKIATVFEVRGNWDVRKALLTEFLAWAEAHKDEKRMMRAHRSLGSLLYQRGDQEQAMVHLSESLRIAESLGDKRGMSRCIGHMGNIHLNQGRYAEAAQCYERQRAICEALGDKHGMARAIGGIGLVHHAPGRNTEAAECFERQRAICETLGDKRGMSGAIGNMGLIHRNQGRYAEAADCYERQRTICEALGDKHGISKAASNLGLVHKDESRYAEATECFEQARQISEALGDKSTMSYAIGNMGLVHHLQGRYSEAAERLEQQRDLCEAVGNKSGRSIAIGNMGSLLLDLGALEDAMGKFREALEGHREIGFRYGMTYWHDGIAKTLLAMAKSSEADMRSTSLQDARKNAEDCIRISEEIGKPDTIFLGRVALARIDAAEGNVAIATEKLEAMLAEFQPPPGPLLEKEGGNEEQIADLHYWLWKIMGAAVGAHHAEALARYTALYTRIPKFEFVKRLAELKGERVPMSADNMEEAS